MITFSSLVAWFKCLLALGSFFSIILHIVIVLLLSLYLSSYYIIRKSSFDYISYLITSYLSNQPLTDFMSQSPCIKCGSVTFRADRSLAGRLVCTRCGSPLVIRKGFSSTRFTSTSLVGTKLNKRWVLFLGLMAILILIIVVCQ